MNLFWSGGGGRGGEGDAFSVFKSEGRGTRLFWGGTHSVTVIVVGNGIGDQNSNPRRDCFLRTNVLGKGINFSVLPEPTRFNLC